MDPNRLNRTTGNCEITADIYATDEFFAQYKNKNPIIFTIFVAVLFVIMICVFLVYDSSVTKRKAKYASSATQSNKILSDLFPGSICDRLLDDEVIVRQLLGRDELANSSSKQFAIPFAMSSGYFSDTKDIFNAYRAPPIADLFLNTTVFYGDIVGKLN